MFRSEKFISMSVIKFQAFTKFFFLVSIFVCSNYLISSNVQNRSQAKSFSNEAWPQFRGNPNLTGLTISDNPELTDLRWTFDVGDSIESSAAISDGMVYVGSQSGNLLAISLDSGQEIWRYSATKFGIGESSPSVGKELVYIGDLDGVLHAVNRSTGEKVWSFRTDGEIKSSPVIVGDQVLVGSYDSHLYSLTAKSGTLIWKIATDGFVHATPSVMKEVTYISGCDETFRAIRVSDGTEIFHIPSVGYSGASSALSGDQAFFGTFSNEVIAINYRTQKISWRYQSEKSQLPFYSSAAVKEGRVILGGRDKRVYCLQASSGEILWTFLTGGRVDSSPVISGNQVYVGSYDGRFYMLSLDSGKELWNFDTGSPLSASPAIAYGKIVIGSHDGQLFCFGSK